MKKLIVPAFFLATFLGAAVLGPLLCVALHPFHAVPFHRVMNVSIRLCALGSVALFGSEIPWAKIWALRRDAWLRVLLGLVFAFVSAQAILGLNLALCGFVWAPLSARATFSRIELALAAALVLPFLKETVYRGFLAHELARLAGRKGGCILSAMLFMLAHYLKVPMALDRQPVHEWSGLEAVASAFAALGHGAFLGWEGLALFLAGMILGGVFLHTGSLWVNAGLHGGWILAVLLFSGLTLPMLPPRVPWLAGGDLLSTPITSLVLLLLAVWIWRYYLPHFSASVPGGNAP